MNTLYIVRHGIAVPHDTPGIAEEDRPLTEEGRKRSRRVAEGLRLLGVAPASIVSSPLPRAWQTAEIVADELGMSSVLESADELKAGRGAASIRDWLDSRPEASLMIVGHDPAFSDLVGLLITGSLDRPICELKRAAVAALTRKREVGEGYRLDWIAPPQLLRRIRPD
jgi:phosphohistidine phosphatase